MEFCEGNWSSAIRWETENGAAVSDEEKRTYVADGKLHVCPYTGMNLFVTYISSNGVVGKQMPGTCDKLGEDGRFKFEYTRIDDDDNSYLYEAYGRVLNGGAGPGFMYGTVTVTAPGGAAGGFKTGGWEAFRIGTGRGELGTHEPPITHTTDGTTPPQ